MANPARRWRPPACPPLALDAARWQAHALDRLQAWGFNTIGNWSEPALGQAKRMPYTLPLSIVGDYASISTGMDWWGACPTRSTRVSPWPPSAPWPLPPAITVTTLG
jgi:hypothetical protein